jgi:hypothetical protein
VIHGVVSQESCVRCVSVLGDQNTGRINIRSTRCSICRVLWVRRVRANRQSDLCILNKQHRSTPARSEDLVFPGVKVFFCVRQHRTVGMESEGRNVQFVRGVQQRRTDNHRHMSFL